MSIKEDILQAILSKNSKTNEKKEKILVLKNEILELKKRGLSASKISEYLKKAYKLSVTPTYLKKIIPELSNRKEHLLKILSGMNEEEIAEVLRELPKEKVEKVFELYRGKGTGNFNTDIGFNDFGSKDFF
jgi:DNA-binding MarR family transcriptional regulator